MPQVETARGPVDTADLGQTLMHEHVFVLTADVQQNYPAEWGSEDDRVADAVSRLQSLHALGIRTIVDPTVVGLGRYVPRTGRAGGGQRLTSARIRVAAARSASGKRRGGPYGRFRQ